jgi:hypothetical protein
MIKAVAIFTLLSCSVPAFACQPPRDMPSGAEEQQAYWQNARIQWEKRLFASVSVVAVATVSIVPEESGPDFSSGIKTRVRLLPVKLLRGASEFQTTGLAENHWCDDFKVSLADKGSYLLAMNGQRILAAVPLVRGQEQAGVNAVFAQFGEDSLWK